MSEQGKPIGNDKNQDSQFTVAEEGEFTITAPVIFPKSKTMIDTAQVVLKTFPEKVFSEEIRLAILTRVLDEIARRRY